MEALVIFVNILRKRSKQRNEVGIHEPTEKGRESATYVIRRSPVNKNE